MTRSGSSTDHPAVFNENLVVFNLLDDAGDFMRRRDFLALAGATAAAWPLGARAQQAAGKLVRIALLSAAVPAANMSEGGHVLWDTFIRELKRLGFEEGRTVIFERYSQAGLIGAATAATLALEIVASGPDLIFFGGASTAASAAAAANNFIPMVQIGGDALSQGLVTNMARPGGNVTALNVNADENAEAKNLELLAQAVPQARKAAYVSAGSAGAFSSPTTARHFATAQTAAAKLNLSVDPIVVEDPQGEAQFVDAFAAIARQRVEMIQFGLNTAINVGSPIIAKLALAARLPAISPFLPFARAGGLISYGANLVDVYRRAAGYVAVILNGAKPGDLPVLQPQVFDLVINQQTAKAIGVTLPTSFLIQATEVIE
jgi:putative ABC transport system substrate-binding protein